MSNGKNEAPIMVFKNAQEKIQTQLLGGVVLTILSVMMFPKLSYAAPLSIGPFLILLYFVNRKIEVVRVYPQHTEIKPAPARGRVFIANKDIRDVHIIKNRVIEITTNKNGNISKNKFSIAFFSDKVKKEIIYFYKEKEKSNRTDQVAA